MNRFEKTRHYVSEKEGRILSAKEFSRLLGVSPTLVGKIERGELPPSPKVAARLAEKYGISREWFLTGEGVAPWEKKEREEGWKFIDGMLTEVTVAGEDPRISKLNAGLYALRELYDSPQKKLVDFVIEAGRNPEYREYIYNVIEGGAAKLLEQLEENRARIAAQEAELEYERAARADLAEKLTDVEVPTPELRPDTTRKAADSKLTFESTVLEFKIPAPPKGIKKTGQDRWERNAKTLNRWQAAGAKNWPATVPPPPWAIEKFCREAVGLYRGGKLGDIGGLLWSFIEEVGG